MFSTAGQDFRVLEQLDWFDHYSSQTLSWAPGERQSLNVSNQQTLKVFKSEPAEKAAGKHRPAHVPSYSDLWKMEGWSHWSRAFCWPMFNIFVESSLKSLHNL